MSNYEIKEKIVVLSGACFWYWSSFYSFLSSCKVPKSLLEKYPKESYNKYQVMRNILDDLETANKTDVIKEISSHFYCMKLSSIDQKNLSIDKARCLLQEFRDLVGNDPIEHAIQRQQKLERRQEHLANVSKSQNFIHELGKINDKFLLLFSSDNPQQRGFELERIFLNY